MGEKLRRPILNVFLHKLCISQQESGMQYTYPTVNTWRKTNYIEAPRLQKEDMPQRHNKERNKQSSNQKIPIEEAIKIYQLNQLDQ